MDILSIGNKTWLLLYGHFFNIKKISSYLTRVKNHRLKLCAHLLLKKNGVKRSQRKVIKMREYERLQTRDRERMREQGSGRGKRGKLEHRREIMES